MAVTIDAPPDQVWPWLVQMGGDRGGWYSWDHLDNAGGPSAQRVHPEWQDIALGGYVKYWTRRHGPVDAWEVAALESNRFLGLHALTVCDSATSTRSGRGHRPTPKGYGVSCSTSCLAGAHVSLSAAMKPSALDQADASMFFVTTSMVRPSSSVGLNSTTSVPAYRIGVCPGPTK